MEDYLEDKIEKLSISKAACDELKKCDINTIQDLMLLINKFVSRKKSRAPQSYNIGIKDAILDIFTHRPNEILNYEEIRDDLIKKYGDNVSNNISSIKSTTLSMAHNGIIERVSAGQYFYPSNDEIIRKAKRQCQLNTPLREAVPEVLKTIDGPFDYKIIREKLRKKYGNEVSTKKSSIKAVLNQLLREGSIEHTEAGDYICRSIV